MPSGTSRRPGVGAWRVSHWPASPESAPACPGGARLHVGPILAAGARARVCSSNATRRRSGAVGDQPAPRGGCLACFPLACLTRKRACLPWRCPAARGARTSSRRPRTSKKTRSGRIAARAGYGQKPAARDCAAANGSSTTHDKSPARRCTPSAHQMPVSRRPAGHFSRGVKVRIMAPFARKTESKDKPT